MNPMRGHGARLLIFLLVIVLLIPGCSAAGADLLALPAPGPASAAAGTPSASPAPSAVPTPTPSPTSPPASPTPTIPPTPSPTPIPTPTPEPGDGDYTIIIDESLQVLSVMAPDSSGQYTVPVCQMPCSTGIRKGLFAYGTYKIYGKSTWMLSSIQTYFRYACRFNGPYLIHSVTYERTNIHTLIRESYQNLGNPASAGCIRLSVRDAKWIFDHCRNGTVVDYRASGGPPVTNLRTLPALEDWMDFDPTDPECADIPAPTPSPLPSPSPDADPAAQAG